jgi:hypothetical protein
MKARGVAGIVVGFLLLTPFPTQAQLDVASVGARAGMIRTLWSESYGSFLPLWSFYPEVQIGGTFFVPYLSWQASWGYWSDGVERAAPIMDMVTYSLSSHIVALRIGFHPQVLDDHVPIPIVVFAGAAEHFIKAERIGGTDYGGERRQNPNYRSLDQSLTPFVGVGVSIWVLPYLNLGAELQQFIPFGSSEISRAQKNRRTFSIGLAVGF